MRSRILLLALVLNAILLGVWASIPEGTIQAQSGCPATYTVQPGDWLAAIARRYGTTLNELIRLNPHLYWRMNLIYVGEKLCIPAQQMSTTGSLSLEVQYALQPSASMTMTLQAPMTSLGIRIPLALQARGGVAVITSTDEISSILSSQPTPVMFAIRNGSPGNVGPDFTLYEVGSSEILSALRLNRDLPLAVTPGCDGQSLTSAFGITATQSVTLTAWLEGKEGTRFPFQVSSIGVVPATSVSTCPYNQTPLKQNLLAFALLPGDSGQPGPPYRVLLHAYSTSGPCYGCDLRFICGAFGPLGQFICGFI